MRKFLVLIVGLFFFLTSLTITGLAQNEENIDILNECPGFCLEPAPGGPIPPTESYGNKEKPRIHWSYFTTVGKSFDSSNNTWGYYKDSYDILDSRGIKTGNIRTYYIEWRITRGTPGSGTTSFYTQLEIKINEVIHYNAYNNTIGYDLVFPSSGLEIRNINLKGFYDEGEVTIFKKPNGDIDQDLLSTQNLTFDIFSKMSSSFTGRNQPNLVSYFFTKTMPKHVKQVGTLQEIYYEFINLREAYKGPEHNFGNQHSMLFGDSLDDQSENSSIHLRIELNFGALRLTEEGHRAALLGEIAPINSNGTRTIFREITFNIYRNNQLVQPIEEFYPMNYSW